MIVVDGEPTSAPLGLVLTFVFEFGQGRIISASKTLIKVRFIDFEGKKATATFKGTGMEVDLEKEQFDGTIDSIEVRTDGGPKGARKVTLPTPTPLEDINDAVDGIKGKPTVKKSTVLDKILQPNDSPFPDVEYTGSKHKNTTKGYDGDDTFNTGGGPDVVYASTGTDRYNAGPGKDTFDASLLGGPVDINLATGRATMGKSKAFLRSVENAIGTKRDDTMTGNNRDNKLEGGNGKDTIKGGGGRDTVKGGKGDDNLNGGPGNDTIEGGPGDDMLRGGPGKNRDTFVFDNKSDKKPGKKNGTDTIKDWDAGKDRIHIEGGKLKDVNVKTMGKNTIIDYDEGRIIIENQNLSKGDIDFLFF